MPQGKGTYGSQVGRPSKKRTSFVNDNGWENKLNDVNKREFINGDNSSILTKAPWTAKNDRFTPPPRPDMRYDVMSNPNNEVPNPKYDPKRDKREYTQAATPRQYSNPIDFSNPVQRRGEQIRGTHPIGNPSKPVMRKHPIGDPKEKITGQLMSGDRKAEWSEFMTDMPKGYRTKEEIGAKRKELLAKK